MSITSHWRPFAFPGDAENRVVVDRAKGVTIWDTDGREYLDATAGVWYCHAGFGRAEIADAVAAQMLRVHAYSTFHDYTNNAAETLADRLVKIARMPNARVMFTSGGSDCVETAIKLARRYWTALEQPNRAKIAVRRDSYHGMHVTSTAASGIEYNRAGFGNVDHGVITVERDDPESLRSVIAEHGAENIAAFLVEPIIGAGGVHFPAEGYLSAVAAICRQHGILLIADEVTSGFGRAGEWFASHRFGLEPDILLCAKALTSGYLPLGAVIVGEAVAGIFVEGGSAKFGHGYTFSGHTAAAAAAHVNLDILESEELIQRGRELELQLADFSSLEKRSVVTEVRAGAGFLAGIQLDPGRLLTEPDLPVRVVRAARRHGVLTRASAYASLQVSPALVVTGDELARIGEGLDAALSEFD